VQPSSHTGENWACFCFRLAAHCDHICK
jgi:hypothetical protein